MASRKHQIILEFVTVPYAIKHSGSSSAFGGSLAHLGTLQVEGSRIARLKGLLNLTQAQFSHFPELHPKVLHGQCS